MDFSAFADDNFNAKDWINQVLEQGKPPDDPLDGYIQTLVMKLQMHSLELNNSLEELSVQALSTIPKAMREVERLRKEASLLKEKINSFNESLYMVESHTDRSVRLLAEIDTVKTRVEGCLRALEQVDKLSKLTQDIEGVFATNDYQKIADKIESMQYSVSILHGVEEYKDSVAQLAKLQNRLEGIMRPLILQAFNTHNIQTSTEYLRIFQKIQKTEQFTQLYYGCVSAGIENYWEGHFRETAQPAGARPLTPQPDDFVKWLPTFFDHLLNVTHTEMRWGNQVFPKEYNVIQELTLFVISRMSRLFARKLEQQTLRPASALPSLLSANSAVQDFAQSLLPAIGEASEASPMRRRILKRLWEPFVPFHLQFAALDRAFVAEELEALKPPLQGDYLMVIAKVEESVPRLLLLLEASMQRCLLFTHFEQAESLARHHSEIIGEYIQHLTKAISALRLKAQLDSSALPKRDDVTAGSAGSAFNVVPYDWSLFQGALQLVSIVANLVNRLVSFDKNLRKVIEEQRVQLFGREFVSENRDHPPTKAVINALCSAIERSAGKFQLVDDDADRTHRLFFFMSAISADGSKRVLGAALSQASALQAAAHTFAFDSVFHFIKDIFAGFPAMPVWRSRGANPDELYSAQATASGAPTSPLLYITQIGNHLWTLSVQQFESLGPSSSPLFQKAAGGAQGEEAEAEGEHETASTETESDQTAVGTQWLGAVARGTVSLYIQRILELSELSEFGAKQLSTDINYLCTFLTGLSITPDPVLPRLLELLQLPPAEIKALPRSQDERVQNIVDTLATIRAKAATAIPP